MTNKIIYVIMNKPLLEIAILIISIKHILDI